MAPGNSGQRIVAVWTDPRRPTGEGTCYQTEDGSVWVSVNRYAHRGTGDERGAVRDGKIVPR